MARIIDLTLEVAQVRKSYSGLHDAILGSAIPRWTSLSRRRAPVDHVALEHRLAELESRLEAIRAEVAALPREELTKRAADETRAALDAYAGALRVAIERLRVICRKLGEAQATGEERVAYDTEVLNADKAAYDMAIQEYKRFGARLTRLMSTY